MDGSGDDDDRHGDRDDDHGDGMKRLQWQVK